MTNAILALVDRAAARFVPSTKAAASCVPVRDWSTDCYCSSTCSPDGGLHAFYYCKYVQINSNCSTSSGWGCSDNQCA